MKTKEQKNESRLAMEQNILKAVPFIVDSFLDKGLISVVVKQLKGSHLFVLFTFGEDNTFTRVRVFVDENLRYVISVVNYAKEVVFMSFCRIDSDFNAVLYHQCSNLADLPF